MTQNTARTPPHHWNARVSEGSMGFRDCCDFFLLSWIMPIKATTRATRGCKCCMATMLLLPIACITAIAVIRKPVPLYSHLKVTPWFILPPQWNPNEPILRSWTAGSAEPMGSHAGLDGFRSSEPRSWWQGWGKETTGLDFARSWKKTNKHI